MHCTTMIAQHRCCYLQLSPMRFMLVVPMVAHVDPFELDRAMSTFIMHVMQAPKVQQSTIAIALAQSLVGFDLPNHDHDPMLEFMCEIGIVDEQPDGWHIFTSGRISLFIEQSQQLCLLATPADLVSQGAIGAGFNQRNRIAYRLIATNFSTPTNLHLQTLHWQPQTPLWISTNANLIELSKASDLPNLAAWAAAGVDDNRVLVELQPSIHPLSHFEA
ncbi:hypothetical protein [Herpetosiphon sp. NSE202]|uniref:hypothetical protein n=1 Tax=Herpetosiphon sp. NSE202 TaxID=3351349 RepID=UPI00362AFF3B